MTRESEDLPESKKMSSPVDRERCISVEKSGNPQIIDNKLNGPGIFIFKPRKN
jgi:hypothetical protein